MKLSINAILFLLVLFLAENGAYALTDFQIKAKCERKPRRYSCIENLKSKKINLLKGNKIEIPVVPYKK